MEPDAEGLEETMETLELEIDGMSCSHCVGAVRGALGSLPGVTVAAVEVGHATVQVQDASLKKALAEALEQEGFTLRAAAPAAT